MIARSMLRCKNRPGHELKDLQRENAQLRRAVAGLSVEKQILKDIAEENF